MSRQRIEKFGVNVVDENDITHSGTQIVRGVRKRYQSVIFCGKEKWDSFPYESSQTEYMNRMAKALLLELIHDADGKGLGGIDANTKSLKS